MSLWDKLKKKAGTPVVRTIDAESVKLWAEFNDADLHTCCKAARLAHKRGVTTVSYQYYKKNDIVTQIDVNIRYCCGCGRKL